MNTISNLLPRRDASNVLMDAHDGNMQLFDGRFFWYAMEYGNYTEGRTGCSNTSAHAAGFRSDHNVSVWSSSDLSDWKLETREALPIAKRPSGIYYRPKVVRHPVTKQYILWVNYVQYPNVPNELAFYLSATASTHSRRPRRRLFSGAYQAVRANGSST